MKKLTPEQVAEIRREYVPYCRERGARAIARRLKLSYMTIFNLVHLNTWAHVR